MIITAFRDWILSKCLRKKLGFDPIESLFYIIFLVIILIFSFLIVFSTPKILGSWSNFIVKLILSFIPGLVFTAFFDTVYNLIKSLISKMSISKDVVDKEVKLLDSWFKIFLKKDFWISIILYWSLGILFVLIFFIFKNRPSWFMFDFDTLYFWTFFTHSFFHNGLDHLLNNLTGYILFVSINFIVFYKYGLKKKFRDIFWITIIILPLVVSIVNYVYFHNVLGQNLPPSCGSSDIVSSFIALTFFSSILVLNINGLKKLFFLMIYILSLGFVIYKDLNQNFAFLVLFIPLLIYAYILFKHQKLAVSSLFISIILLFFLSVYTKSIFPEILINAGSLTNIQSHYLGLVFGFVVGYIKTSNHKGTV